MTILFESLWFGDKFIFDDAPDVRGDGPADVFIKNEKDHAINLKTGNAQFVSGMWAVIKLNL